MERVVTLMLDEEDVYETALEVLRGPKGSQYEKTLRALLEFEIQHSSWYDEQSPTGHAWEVKDAPVSPQRASALARKGLLHLVHQTNRYKVYCVAHPDEVRRAMAPLEHERDLVEIGQEKRKEIELDGLFEWIVGYDDIKFWTRKAITAEKPVHINYDGPPSTAKTAFLLELHRIPGARYCTGSHMTKAGLWEILYFERPAVLCIDEFEKLRSEDYNLLYTLLADGFIQKDQHQSHLRLELDTRVFASTNHWMRVPEPIRSRFKHWEFSPYTKEEYVEIASGMLVAVEGADPDMAEYIAEVTGEFTRDIREAIRYARLCDLRDEVDMLRETDMRWKR